MLFRLVSEITYYQRQISMSYGQIGDLQGELRRYRNLYDTLRGFQNIVQNSQNNFNSVHNSQKGILKEIDLIKAHNKAASAYYHGMSNILNGIGSKIVILAYSGLLRQVGKLLIQYSNKITECNNEIRSCQRRISNFENEIQEARKLEREAQNNG